MAAIPYPDINGFRYQWSDIRLILDGIGQEATQAVKSLKYDDKLSRAKHSGNNMAPVGRTKGKYECSGSITFLRQEFDLLIVKLGDHWGLKSFNIQVQYGQDGQPVVTDVLEGCLLNGASHDGSEGEDGLEVECELDIMRIKRGGLYLF